MEPQMNADERRLRGSRDVETERRETRWKAIAYFVSSSLSLSLFLNLRSSVFICGQKLSGIRGYDQCDGSVAHRCGRCRGRTDRAGDGRRADARGRGLSAL